MSGLLISVRSILESESASKGGADIIDIKEPRNGPLGRAEYHTIERIARPLYGQRKVSAAMGELEDWEGSAPPPLSRMLDFVKVGLRGQRNQEAWKERLLQQMKQSGFRPAQIIAVAYADDANADSPEPGDIAEWAAAAQVRGVLLDTFSKQDSWLGDFISEKELQGIAGICQANGLLLTLAGSLNAERMQYLAPLQPDYFGVRGAACCGGVRNCSIAANQVRLLKEKLRALAGPVPAAAAVPANLSR